MTSPAAAAHKQPRYRRIEQWLEEQCDELPVGSPLPSEAELAKMFSVSRMTVRNAMQALTASGRIERRQGLGSFVGAGSLHRQDSVLFSFTEEMRQRGMDVTSKLIDKTLGVFPNVSTLLGQPRDAWLVHITRVRLANDIPLALERVFLPIEFKAVLDADLEQGSLHETLRQMGVEFGSASGTVTARLATEDELGHLNLAGPRALLVESRVVRDVADAVIEHTETAYLGDKWAIDTHSSVQRMH